MKFLLTSIGLSNKALVQALEKLVGKTVRQKDRQLVTAMKPVPKVVPVKAVPVKAPKQEAKPNKQSGKTNGKDETPKVNPAARKGKSGASTGKQLH